MQKRSTLVASVLLAFTAACSGADAPPPPPGGGDEQTTGPSAVVATGDDLGESDELFLADADELDAVDEAASASLDDATDGTDGATLGLATDVQDLAGTGSVDAEAQATKSRTNSGRFFKPAGCLTSTISILKGTVKHVFNKCTGPGGHVIDGTVVAAWSLKKGHLAVSSDTERGFTIDGYSISRSGSVTLDREDGVWVLHRTLSLSGDTRRGFSFSRDADWTVKVDRTTHCRSRQGSASGEITRGTTSRSYAVEITNLRVCGAPLSCPERGGKIEASATKSKDDATKTRSLEVELLGGRSARVTLTNAKGETKVKDRKLFCRE